MGPVSHSMLDSFETCPRKHYLVKVAKTVVEPQGEAATWGDWVHKQFEAALRDGTPLPDKIAGWQPIVDRVCKIDGPRLVEQRLAVDSSLQPASWKDSWFRAIVDLVVIAGDTAYSFDWKTGKKKPSAQLDLSAAVVLANYPQVTRVKNAFVWLKDGSVTRSLLTSGQESDIWAGLIPRVKRLEAAFDADKWPARPSGLCNGWCPAGRAHCEHWKEKR